VIDSEGLMASIVWRQAPGASGTWWIKVLDLDTGGFTDTLVGLPPMGLARLIEPYPGRLYVFWTNRGISQTQARLYPLTRTMSNGMRFVLDPDYQDVSAALSGLMIQGPVYFATPRGGTPVTNLIDGFIVTCPTSCKNYEPESIYHLRLQF
jgi:hypothetical protein